MLRWRRVNKSDLLETLFKIKHRKECCFIFPTYEKKTLQCFFPAHWILSQSARSNPKPKHSKVLKMLRESCMLHVSSVFYFEEFPSNWEKALVFVLFLRFWKNRWYICSQKCFLLLAFSRGKFNTEKFECFSKIQLQFSPHSFLTFWISILKVFFMTSYL